MTNRTARGLAGIALAGGLVTAASAAEVDDVRAALEAPFDAVASWAAVDIASLRDGWKSSGLTVEEGDYVTILGHGAVSVDGGAAQTPHQFLWLRIGDGPTFAPAGNEDTFRAPRGGEIAVAVKPREMFWDDPSGALPGGFESLPDAPLDAGATLVVWRDDPAAGLAALSRTPDDAFARARAAFLSAPELPADFAYHWRFGHSNVFAAWSDGERSGVRGLPNAYGGIIRKPVDIPLTEDTEFSFEWLYDNVPARGPETEAQFHDYISIALEFDNGQDLTWMRAAHVEAGLSFHCPLPWWDTRETHMILESGEDGLGEWRAHTRRVAADYESAVGGPLPGRITGVWFINVGAFGGGVDGDARFANVAIRSGGEQTEIFAAE